MFSRGFKKSGVEHLSTYLKMYKIGDIVDVKGDYLKIFDFTAQFALHQSV